nr:MAG TPA: hypothetical protein [Caudoviricetes sp.]
MIIYLALELESPATTPLRIILFIVPIFEYISLMASLIFNSSSELELSKCTPSLVSSHNTSLVRGSTSPTYKALLILKLFIMLRNSLMDVKFCVIPSVFAYIRRLASFIILSFPSI